MGKLMNIIPKPLKACAEGGVIAFSSSTKISGDFPQTAAFAEKLLADVKPAAENAITLAADSSVPAEGYRIKCENGSATVAASDEAGAFYAVMTMSQLAAGGNSFPAASIEDSPRFGHRGFMLDCSRHFWTVDKIKQILDVMASLKMNIFHWHLSEDQGWRIEIKKYPLLTEKGSIRASTALSLKGYQRKKEPRDFTEYGRGLFYTQDEAREVVAYAAERHINIIPEIDMPGHLVAAIACYPELSCTGEKTEVCTRWGVMDNIGCCGKEDIYNFVKDVIDELVEIFPYRYFHIGGDEVPKTRWKKCPTCQAKIKELGLKNEDELQGHFNNEIAKYLKGKGRTMIGWNEILDSFDSLDKDIIPQWWIKRRPTEKLELKWLKSGGKLLLSMVDYVYMDHAYAIRPLEKTYGFGPKTLGIDDDTNIVGIEAPQWTEYIRDEDKLDLNTYARLIAISEAAWTQEANKNYDDFSARLENMRPYFGSLGAKIAPAEIYCGKTCSPLLGGRVANGWRKWRADPYFELTLARKYGF